MSSGEEIKILIKAAKKASIKAKREAKALGLTVRVIERGSIYDKTSDGKKLLVGKINYEAKIKPAPPKGTILHLRNEQS